MGFKVVLTQSAQADANEYAEFIAITQAQPAAAAKWLDGLEFEFETISNSPTAFAVIPEQDEFETELRQRIYHSHRIIYLIDSVRNEVVVLRIYHGSRRPLIPGDVLGDQ